MKVSSAIILVEAHYIKKGNIRKYHAVDECFKKFVSFTFHITFGLFVSLKKTHADCIRYKKMINKI